jgi:hypothetical protein
MGGAILADVVADLLESTSVVTIDRCSHSHFRVRGGTLWGEDDFRAMLY